MRASDSLELLKLFCLIMLYIHVETTFVPKFPIEMAGMIELGKKNTWSDRIRNGTERKEKLSRSLSNDYCSLKKKLDRKIEKYLFYPGN